MTDDSHAAPARYGPFHDGVDVTAPIVSGAESQASGTRFSEPGGPATASAPAEPRRSAEPDVTTAYDRVRPAAGSAGATAVYGPTADPTAAYGPPVEPAYDATVGTAGASAHHPAMDPSHGAATTTARPTGAPAYGRPYPPHQPTSGYETSGPVALPVQRAAPAVTQDSGSPVPGAPASSHDAYTPTSGAGAPAWVADPVSGAGAGPYGFDTSVARGPRIEPSPPPSRNRLVTGILVGLLAGLVLFGTGGWFVGRATGKPAPSPAVTAAPALSVTPSLGVYEQSQLALNQPKFSGSLAMVAQSWLPYLSNCARSGTSGGPVLNKGEKVRVRCQMDAMSVVFVEYTSIADRDKARVKALGANVDARRLAPGVAPAAQKPTPSGHTNGNYVEYAYKLTERRVTRTVSAIWWDDTQTPVAAYLLAYWKEGVGQKWEPMRDVWTRYA